MNETDNNTADLSRYVVYFCGTVLTHYQEVLSESELIVCQLLLKGQSIQSASKTLGLSGERVRQIFLKSIRKISRKYEEKVAEMEALREENTKLKHRNFFLENEALSEQSLKNVESQMKRTDSGRELSDAVQGV